MHSNILYLKDQTRSQNNHRKELNKNICDSGNYLFFEKCSEKLIVGLRQHIKLLLCIINSQLHVEWESLKGT